MTRRLFLVLVLAGLGLLSGLGAPVPSASAQAARPATDGAASPYDDELMKLSELLGALHYLRPLCGAAGETQVWRQEMQALIEAENPSEERRGKFVASFNRGYASYAQVYRSCTPSARLAVDRQLAESERLAHDIVVRFGAN